VRQSIIDQPFAMQYSCFHLEHNGERVNDFIELSDVKGVSSDSVFTVVEDPYTEKEARMHIIRVRELIGAASERNDIAGGFQSGASLHDAVIGAIGPQADGSDQLQKPTVGDLSAYKFSAPASAKSLIPQDYPAPKTVKSIALSVWNPPPAHLRNKGHLLYLVIVNLEGEQFHITSHVSGFFVNRSSHNKFDPSPKGGPKTSSAHSLLTLLHQIDPHFKAAFQELLEHNSRREPLALFTLTNALPSQPWLVAPDCTSLVEHRPDVTRTQESYLIAGTDNNDNLRDWNEEFQSTRELPVESVQDRVFRERLTSKLFADFNEAAVKGAVLVARGEIPPLNPTEARDAQIFVHNNVFFSFGADGVGTFATEGGDEAARVATGKDVSGVQLVNQLDITGLFTAGSIIVDYLGKRIVGQSIVPGIFRQKEPEENQIDYGGVEGKDVIAENETFVKPFEQLSKATYVKKHAVWDKEGKRHDLEASVDTKGLLGPDGRKYVLDLYRLTPLDVTWIEQHWAGEEATDEEKAKKDYPHRMATLRPELIGTYRLVKLREFVNKQVDKNRAAANGDSDKKKEITNGSDEQKDGEPALTETETKDDGEKETEKEKPTEHVPISTDGFEFSLNPDVYSGQVPQTEEEKAQMEKDEADVRAVCEHLTSDVIPKLIQQLQEGDVGFPIDGESLTGLMHKRGINIRYLGTIAEQCDKNQPRVQALRSLAIQEMVARGLKHLVGKYMRHLPPVFASACMAHLLNCLLGLQLNSSPTPEVDESLREIFNDADMSFEKVTIDALKDEIKQEVRRRFRYELQGDLVEAGKELQMLREVSLKLGLQLLAKDFAFTKNSSSEPQNDEPQSATNGTNHANKKKKKGKETGSPLRAEFKVPVVQTFHADDIVNFVPVVKDAAPKVSSVILPISSLLTLT
jgi:protein TIF31